MKIIITFTVL